MWQGLNSHSISISIQFFVFFKIQIQVCLHSTKSNKTEQNGTNISLDTQPFILRKNPITIWRTLESTYQIFNDFIIVIYVFIIFIHLQICLHNDFNFLYFS